MKRKTSIVYRRVRALMFMRDITIAEFAEKLGISKSALFNKLHGEAPFTLEEALKIKAILGTDEPIERLFAHEEDNQ